MFTIVITLLACAPVLLFAKGCASVTKICFEQYGILEGSRLMDPLF